GAQRPALLLVQLLPRILHRGAHRFDLDVGELAADPAHFAQILVLHDVAGGRVDRDRSARAVRVLEILQELHGPVRVELAFLLLDRVHDGRHAVVAAHGDEVGRLVRAVVALPRSEEHTSELQSRGHLVCRLLLEKKKKKLNKNFRNMSITYTTSAYLPDEITE